MMKPSELASFRKSLGLDREAFGAWVSEQIGIKNPWPGYAVEAWETGEGSIPFMVQTAVYRGLWERDRP